MKLAVRRCNGMLTNCAVDDKIVSWVCKFGNGLSLGSLRINELLVLDILEKVILVSRGGMDYLLEWIFGL